MGFSLQDWADITPVAKTVGEDTPIGTWDMVVAGPDSQDDDSTQVLNTLPGLLRVGSTADHIKIDPSVPVIKVVESSTDMVLVGNLNGGYGIVADKYGLAAGDSTLAAHYIIINGTDGTITMKGSITLTNQITSADISDVGANADQTSANQSATVAALTGHTLDSLPNGATYGRAQLGVLDGGYLYLLRKAAGTTNQFLITATGMEGYANSVKNFELASGVAYLGDQANEHIKLSSSGMQIYDGGTLYATYGATTTIGQVGAGQNNIYMTGGSLSLRNNITDIITLSSAGVAGINVLAGGNITLIGDDTNTGILKWDGTKDISFGTNTSGGVFGIWPEDTGTSTFNIGWKQSTSTGSLWPFQTITLRADSTIGLYMDSGSIDAALTLNTLRASLSADYDSGLGEASFNAYGAAIDNSYATIVTAGTVRLTIDKTGLSTFTGNIGIPDSGYIGNTSDPDLLQCSTNLLGVNGSIYSTGDYRLTDGNYVGIVSAERLEFYTAGYAAFVGCDVHMDGDLLVNGGNIGITADPDLLGLASGVLTVNGRLGVTSTSTADQTVYQRWQYPGATAYNLDLKTTITAGVVRWTFDQVNAGTSYSNVLTLDRGNVIIGDTSSTYKLRVKSTGTSLFNLESTDAGTTGIVQEYYHNSASPADSDFIAVKKYYGNDSVPAKTEYWREEYGILDITSPTQDSAVQWYGMNGGEFNYCFGFTGAGAAYADDDWYTFSPDIKKHSIYKDKAELVSEDYLKWALEDAKKPNKPFKGATTNPTDVTKYAKSACKIAMGTAIWAEDANERIKQLEKELKQLKTGA